MLLFFLFVKLSSAGLFVGYGCGDGFGCVLANNWYTINNGKIDLSFSDSNMTLYNVQLICTNATSPFTSVPYSGNNFTPLVNFTRDSTLQTGQTVNINALQCYSGKTPLVPPIAGGTFSGSIWIKYTNSSGAPSAANPFVVKQLAYFIRFNDTAYLEEFLNLLPIILLISCVFILYKAYRPERKKLSNRKIKPKWLTTLLIRILILMTLMGFATSALLIWAWSILFLFLLVPFFASILIYYLKKHVEDTNIVTFVIFGGVAGFILSLSVIISYHCIYLPPQIPTTSFIGLVAVLLSGIIGAFKLSKGENKTTLFYTLIFIIAILLGIFATYFNIGSINLWCVYS